MYLGKNFDLLLKHKETLQYYLCHKSKVTAKINNVKHEKQISGNKSVYNFLQTLLPANYKYDPYYS